MVFKIDAFEASHIIKLINQTSFVSLHVNDHDGKHCVPPLVA